MKNNKRSIGIKILALLLACVLTVPAYVSAALPETAEPQASNYILDCTATVSNTSGTVRVTFKVWGYSTMDEIGVSNIELFESTDNENWTLVKSYDYWDYSTMMGYNQSIFEGYVTYSGVSGRYYKAYMWFYAGKNGTGDTETQYAYMK